jgi:hypothetical protein
LADYVNEKPPKSLRLSYFGAADPAYYGLQTPPLFDEETGAPLDFARANPAAGLYALSVNHLLGQVLDERDFFDWFRHHEATDQVGYSILLYDVPQAASGSWMAHCLDPISLLEQDAAAALVGQDDMRHVYFECRNSWVFPEDGAPGWYILPQQDSWPIAAAVNGSLKLVYQHGASLGEPSYAVWYWDGQADLTALADITPVSPPVQFGTAVTLTGYQIVNTDWWTLWQVQAALAEPVTLAAHLYADDPTPLVGDQLGFSSEQWQPGDWFVQMHHFEGDGRYLETGLYNYVTGERLPSNQETPFIQLPNNLPETDE